MSKEPLSIWKNTKVQIHEIINTYCIESLNSPFRDSSIDWSAYIDPSFVLPCIEVYMYVVPCYGPVPS